MVNISPLSLHLAQPEFAQQLASLPYDVFNEQEARAYVQQHPLAFIGIDRPETFFAEGTSPYDAKVYQKAHDELQQRELAYYPLQLAQYYLYQLKTNTHQQTGIIAGFTAEDYQHNLIKKHELTRKEKEDDRVRHIEKLGAQTGPIFLVHKRNPGLKAVVEEIQKNTQPIIEFKSEEDVYQTITIVPHEFEEAISQHFGEMPAIYIADGHHRTAAAVRASATVGNGKVMSVIFPEEEMAILPYHRVISDISPYNPETLVEKLNQEFNLITVEAPVQPTEKGTVGLWLNQQWYQLRLKTHDPQALDATLLSQQILEPILNIQDIRTDERIDFVGGNRALQELEQYPLAFAMHPTSIQELFKVADEAGIMPPKSTWFEPKLYSGLFYFRG